MEKHFCSFQLIGTIESGSAVTSYKIRGVAMSDTKKVLTPEGKISLDKMIHKKDHPDSCWIIRTSQRDHPFFIQFEVPIFSNEAAAACFIGDMKRDKSYEDERLEHAMPENISLSQLKRESDDLPNKYSFVLNPSWNFSED